MESIKLDCLLGFATRTRQAAYQKGAEDEYRATEVGSPIFGSYHLLYPVKFNDGVRWLFKVPADATRGKFRVQRDDSSLACPGDAHVEARHYHTTTEGILIQHACDNELNSLFILVEYLEGRPFYDVWFNEPTSMDIVCTRRTRALRDIAAAMTQLDRVTFDQGGSLRFDEQDFPIGVGPSRLVDTPAMLARLLDDDPDESTIYLPVAPFSYPAEYYTVILDRREEPGSGFERGLLALLRLLISWIFEPSIGDTAQKPFVLARADMDIQNFLVDDNGILRAIIDWDGVFRAPHTLGNRRNPSFLT